MNSCSELYIGLMSGTSVDGIDAVLVDFSEERPRLLACFQGDFSSELQAEILALNHNCDNELNRAFTLHRELGHLFSDSIANLLAEADKQAEEITAIGSHGQTLRHQPNGKLGFTLQVGDAATIAEETSITTCANFRCRDIAAGGQGAPLVPAFHSRYLRDAEKTRAVINIGGMANITLLKPNAAVSGFDSGPGNVLMDAWVSKHLQKPFDQSGEWAASGIVNQKLLNEILADEYFSQTGPKSTGREKFDQHFIEPFHNQDTPENIQATLLELTARSICDALDRSVDELLICGGGAHNKLLLKRIADLSDKPVLLTDEFGLPADWLEAMAFAWLARCLMRGEPANEPAVTGAKSKRVLGAIFPA